MPLLTEDFAIPSRPEGRVSREKDNESSCPGIAWTG